MITGINFQETKDYIIKAEAECQNPTIFVLGHISRARFFEIVKDVIDHKGEVDINAITGKSVEIFCAGVREIKNLCLSSGESPKDFKIHDIANIVDNLPFTVVMEVAGEIIRMNFLTEDFKKK